MNLADWVGRTQTTEDQITATPIAALSATLDRDAARPAAGTPIPALWHWLYFLPLAPQSEIGPDGHAKRGGFLPPVDLPRRMWAGSQLRFDQPLRVGDSIERRSTIESIATHYLEALRSRITHCLSPEAGRFTPSDFPLANLDDQPFDKLARMIGCLEDASI